MCLAAPLKHLMKHSLENSRSILKQTDALESPTTDTLQDVEEQRKALENLPWPDNMAASCCRPATQLQP